MKSTTLTLAARFTPFLWILSLICFLTLSTSALTAADDASDKRPLYHLGYVYTDQTPAIGVFFLKVDDQKPILFLVGSKTEITLDGKAVTIEQLSERFYNEDGKEGEADCSVYLTHFRCRIESDGKNLKLATKIQASRYRQFFR